MIAHLPARVIETLARKSTEISDYLASNLASVLALQVDFEPSRLAIFQFETEDLDSVGPYPAAVRVLSDHGLYAITAENVSFIFRNVLGSGSTADLEIKHYSTVLRAGEAPLIDKVHGDFDRYLKGVFLRPSNSEEDVSAILDVLNHEEIESEFLEQFLEQQRAKLPTLERVPARLRSAVFRLSKIEPAWENCSAYLTSEEFDAQTLTAYLERTEVRSILSQVSVGGQNEARPLRLFLFNNNDFDIDSFRAYIRRLPRKFDQFSETVGEDKLRVLVEEEAVTFSEKAFSYLADKEELQVLFVAKNIDSFLANEEKFSVTDDFREKLLDSAIGDERKLKVIDKMDMAALSGSALRASLVARIIHRTDANVSKVPAEAACAMVVNLEPVQIQVAMFNRCQKLMSDEQVRAVIQQLPKPYSEIEPGWRQPTIPNTPENQELVRWLQSRSIISSSKVTASFFSDAEIRIFNFRK